MDLPKKIKHKTLTWNLSDDAQVWTEDLLIDWNYTMCNTQYTYQIQEILTNEIPGSKLILFPVPTDFPNNITP